MIIILLIKKKRKVENTMQALMLEIIFFLNFLQSQRVLTFNDIRDPIEDHHYRHIILFCWHIILQS